MCHQQVGGPGVGTEPVQQVVDPLRQLHHAFAAGIAVCKVGLGDPELCTVPGRALILAKALLPEQGLAPGRDAGGIGDGSGGVGGAGQGRIEDLVNGGTAAAHRLPQFPCLLLSPGGQGAVGHAADLVFHIPHRLPVGCLLQGIVPGKLHRIPFVDPKAGQFFVRIGQGALCPGGVPQQDVTQHRLPGRQLLTAVHLFFNAHNTVDGSHNDSFYNNV